MNISCTSRSRATRPLIRYSLCPERYNLRLTTTSPGFTAKTGLSAVFFRRFPLTNSGSAAVSSALGATSASEGAASCIPSAAPSIGPSLFSAPSVVNSWFSPALSSTNRAASASSGSSIVIITSANPIGGRFVVPLKMQSAMRSARNDLWLCSPSTQETASTTFDFPQPFGPTMQVMPLPLNATLVRSQNDLKPAISTLRSLSTITPMRPDSRSQGLRQHTRRETKLYSPSGGGFERQCDRVAVAGASDRYAIAGRNVWQVPDQSPAAWRMDGGTSKNTSMEFGWSKEGSGVLCGKRKPLEIRARPCRGGLCVLHLASGSSTRI